jgi:two-component system, oxyanion-binding sensor
MTVSSVASGTLASANHESDDSLPAAAPIEIDSSDHRPMTSPAFSISMRRRALRVGFVALVDAAPIIIAKQLGFFAKAGVEVDLQREIGWATIREKVIHGELEAAHAPAAMLWSAQLGCGCPPVDVLTAMVLNAHGNAITLSQKLWDAGVRDGASLRAHTGRRRLRERLTLAVPFRYSSHHILLRRWLAMAGFESDRDVRVVVVPPPQMVQRLESGSVDGYCVGEPWNSIAVRKGVGWCAAWSAAITRGDPEKVLMVRRAFAENCPAEHAAMVAALAEACAWCERPENHESLADLMAGEKYIHVPPSAILPALSGHFDCGNKQVQTIPDFLRFHAGETNVPTVAKAQVIQAQLVAAGTIENDERLTELPGSLFREDIYRAALAGHPWQPSEVRPGGSPEHPLENAIHGTLHGNPG